MIYYPEMNEKPAPRLFNSRHVYNGNHSLRWSPENHAQAEKTLKELRIKPKQLKLERSGIDLIPSAKTRWACLVTQNAHSKLLEADLCACELLLD